MSEEKRPAPLVPAEVDLRDFPYMPLDVRRLRDSRLISTRSYEEIVAAILLWSASWHQQPASSLPGDESELAQLAGYGRAAKEFKKVMVGAMHGLILCSDGRWYHPVVAQKAAEAWNAKLETEWRRACDRVRKDNKDRKERQQTEVGIPPRPPLLFMTHSDGIPTWDYRNSEGIPTEQLRNSSLKGKGKGERTEIKGDSGSVSSAKASETGAKAPRKPDQAKEEIWATGRAILEGQGETRDGAGSFLGKLVKDYGQIIVLQAVRDCATATPANAKEWLTARCQERRGASKQSQLERRNADVGKNWAAGSADAKH